MKPMNHLFFIVLFIMIMSSVAVSCGDNTGSGASNSNKDSNSISKVARGADIGMEVDSIPDSLTAPDSMFTSLDSETFKESKRKALLIGVGHYPQYEDEEENWGQLSSHNDIHLLAGPLHELGFAVDTLTDNEVTHENLKRTLDKFIKNCHEGDTVLLHFSGHGQQKVDEEGDEIGDTLTECFIPYDARMKCSEDPKGYRGQNHFTDDEMHKYVTRLRDSLGKDGFLLITMDACHSAGSTGHRGQGSGTINRKMRGTKDVFGKDILKSAPKKKRKVVGTANKAKFLALSACESRENNYETEKLNSKGEKVGYGSLSYAIYEQLLEMKKGKITFEELAEKVCDNWSEPHQHPCIDNDDEKLR